MKVIRAFCLCWLLMLADGVSAQLVDKVLSVLGEDSVGSVTVARTDSDSIQLSLVRQELETARLNEANLRMEMEQMKLAGYAADSVKLALQKQRIDSLRTVHRVFRWWWRRTLCSICMPSVEGIRPNSEPKM